MKNIHDFRSLLNSMAPKPHLYFSAVLLAISLAACAPVQQSVITPNEPPGWNEYSSKFVCGTIQPTTNINTPLNVGRYFTTVNVHNPALDRKALLWYKVAVSGEYPELMAPSLFKEAALTPDQSLYIDCEEIISLAAVALGFMEGWLVILTPEKLDVSPVYTAGSEQTIYPVQSIEIERVEPSKVNPRDLEIVEVPAPGHCPGGSGCCCNITNRTTGQLWPPCDSGFECRGWRPGPTPPAGPVATCTAKGRNPIYAEPLHSSQPRFCGNP